MIVLDTHALVWWVTGDATLSKKAMKAIEREQSGGVIIVSAISAWEISMLVAHGRLVLSMDVGSWLATVAEIESVRFFRWMSKLLLSQSNCLESFIKTQQICCPL